MTEKLRKTFLKDKTITPLTVKEYTKMYNTHYYIFSGNSIKVSCEICNRQISKGWLSKHQQSKACKPPKQTKEIILDDTNILEF